MKTQELQSAIKKLKKVISPRNTLPILDYIYNNNGTLTASDLETYHIVNVGFSGKFLIDAKELNRILDKLPKDVNISITGRDTKIHVIIEKMGEFKLLGGNVEDFVSTPKVVTVIGKLAASDVEIMRKAAKFANDDELRPVMNGVYLEKKIVASDAVRMVYYDYSKRLKRNVLIPAKTVRFLDAVDYDVCSNEKFVKLVNEDETIIIRQIDGKYPNYLAVIPKNETFYMMDNKLLQQTVKLAMVAANEASELIRFKFSGSTLLITAQDIDFERSFSRSLPVKYHSGYEPFEIGFKAPFLLSLLAEANDVVKLSFSTPEKAMIIDDNKLLMPMMINT